jgi:hypothetical protein
MRKLKIQILKFISLSFVIYLIYVFIYPIGLNEQFYNNDKFPNLNKMRIFRDNTEVIFK